MIERHRAGSSGAFTPAAAIMMVVAGTFVVAGALASVVVVLALLTAVLLDAPADAAHSPSTDDPLPGAGS